MTMYTGSAALLLALCVAGFILACVLLGVSKPLARASVRRREAEGLVAPEGVDVTRAYEGQFRGGAAGVFIGTWLAASLGFVWPALNMAGYQLGAFVASLALGATWGHWWAHRRAVLWGESPHRRELEEPGLTRSRAWLWRGILAAALVGVILLIVHLVSGILFMIGTAAAALVLWGVTALTDFSVARATMFGRADGHGPVWQQLMRSELVGLMGFLGLLAAAATQIGAALTLLAVPHGASGALSMLQILAFAPGAAMLLFALKAVPAPINVRPAHETT